MMHQGIFLPHFFGLKMLLKINCSNDKYGNLDLQSNVKIHNYDTNKLTSLLLRKAQVLD